MSIKSIINPFEYVKKKNELKEYEHMKKTGLVVHGISDEDNKKNFHNFFANALINFCVCFGTVGCFVSPFEIKANMFVLAIIALFFSVITAFLYYNNAVKMIGYVALFSGFIFLILQNKQMIKGGFGHICNKMMAFLERNFALPIERGYEIYGYSEKISVTVCLCFILFAVILMFNMAITESKGFLVIFLFTFPIIQLGMYFDRDINVFYFALYVIGLISLHTMRCSEHYKMETKKKKGYFKKQKNNDITFDYVTDGKYNLAFVIVVTIFVLCFSLVVSLIYPQNKSNIKLGFEYLKEDTEEFAEQAALLGFFGMLSRNGGAGGVGRSRLGQNKYVALDYEKDLEIQTHIEEDESGLYLKAYNGTYYNDEYWELLSESKNDKVTLKDYGLTAEDVIELPVKLNEVYDLSFVGRSKYIVVSNVGANPLFSYFPYYSIIPGESEYVGKYDDEYTKGLEKNYSMLIEYLPILSNFTDIDSIEEEIEVKQEYVKEFSKLNEDEIEYIEMEEKYSEYVKEVYLDVPKENIEAIEEFCENYDLDADTYNVEYKVCEAFDRDYEYTLIPGKTPKNKEFVNYFLSESKKGYCVYFATSATLIYRYLGIPARYCGGYSLQQTEFDIPEQFISFEESRFTHWLKEYNFNEMYYPYGLGKYELDDSMAHAWVEIYIDGFGWFPIEVTPGDYNPDEESEEEEGFVQDLLSGNIITGETIKTVKNITISFVQVVIYLIVLFIIGYIVLGFIVRYTRKGQRDVDKKYMYLNKCAKYIGIKKSDSRTYEEFANLLINAGVIESEKIMEVIRIVEKNKFSKNNITKNEEKIVSDIINEISKNIYINIKWYKKIMFKFISWL